MKKILLFAGLLVGLTSFTYQNNADQIAAAFRSADAGKVGEFFDDFIDMKLQDKDEVKNIGKNQATITLKTFFSENGIKGFDKTSERELGTTMYITGKLTNSGKGYNATIMIKVKDGQHRIISLRIS